MHRSRAVLMTWLFAAPLFGIEDCTHKHSPNALPSMHEHCCELHQVASLGASFTYTSNEPAWRLASSAQLFIVDLVKVVHLVQGGTLAP